MLPYLAKIGSVLIPTMVVFWCLGNLAGSLVLIYLARREGLGLGKVMNFLLVILAASIVGAKISAVLLITKPEELDWFLRHPAEIFKIWKSGFSLYGIIVFGSLAGLWYALRTGLPVWRMADLTVPGMGLGHAIQCLGDFLAGAHSGIPTGLPWGVSITHWVFPGPQGVPLHPVMLYLSAIGVGGLLAAWFWLYTREKKNEKKYFLSWFLSPLTRLLRLRYFNGELYFLGGAFYAVFRFFVEFTRDPRTLIWYPDFPLPQTQMACIAFFAFSLAWYLALRAIWETEQKRLPYRSWMKLGLRVGEGVRWIAKRIPYKVKSEKSKVKS